MWPRANPACRAAAGRQIRRASDRASRQSRDGPAPCCERSSRQWPQTPRLPRPGVPPLALRSNRGMPWTCSSAVICRLTAEGATNSSSQARRMKPVLATARKYLSTPNCIEGNTRPPGAANWGLSQGDISRGAPLATGASGALTMVACTPASRATVAIACAWFQMENATTPLARCVSVMRAMQQVAPRILNEPVGTIDSVLRSRRRGLAAPANGSKGERDCQSFQAVLPSTLRSRSRSYDGHRSR
jgi:hypothetical protein